MNLKKHFDYDRESSKLTTHENNELIFNGSTKIYDPLSEYENPVIRKQRTDINPMPKNPIIYYYDNCLEESGYSYLSFDLPEISIDNDLLDTNNMWYEVYIDDELYTFTPEMYMYLDEPMTKVPYNFIDDYDFIYWGNSRGIYFYVDVLNSIGLRLYNEFNGEVYASELVSCGEVSTIKQINSSEVESEEYYTLTGIRTNNPQNGIFIKRTHLANGKVTTEKVRK